MLSLSCFLSSPMKIIQRITFVNPPAITPEWKRNVAQDAIESLSAAKLAKSICSQFRTRLNSSHDAFAASLRQVHQLKLETLFFMHLHTLHLVLPWLLRSFSAGKTVCNYVKMTCQPFSCCDNDDISISFARFCSCYVLGLSACLLAMSHLSHSPVMAFV